VFHPSILAKKLGRNGIMMLPSIKLTENLFCHF